MTNGNLRIGILGAARIAQKNATAIGQIESECIVTAVASRTQAKAEDLVKEFIKESAVTIFGGENAYDDLVNSQDVCDAIYIPLPTVLHKEWVCKALRAGKHVLVEKPVALSGEEYQEMLQIAYETGKFLMDGTMYPHHNRTHDFLCYAHDENEIGRVDRIETCFSFQGDEMFFENNIRTKKDGDPLGCIGDLGWYCIRMALLVFSTKPVSARVLDVKLTSDGVPLSASCVVHFENDRELFFQCGFLSLFQQTVEICGSKKSIKMHDYVLPKENPPRFELHSKPIHCTDPSTNHDAVTVLSETGPVQEVKMWRNFSILAGSVKPGLDGWTGQENVVAEANEIARLSLANQKVLDALMESILLAASVKI